MKERKTPPKKGKPRIGEKTVEGYVIGRNKAVIPPEEVEKLASIGMKDIEIADWFGVNENTLRYNFYDILDFGRCKMKMTLRQQMFRNAIQENNTVMQIFLSKNYLGMSSEPLNSEANAPLPWVETEEDDTIIEEYDEDQEDETNEEDQAE